MAAWRIGRSDLARETLLTLGLVGLVGVIALGVSGLGQSNSHAGHQGMPGMGPMTGMGGMLHSDGKNSFERGYRLVPDTVPHHPGAGQPVAFRIMGPERTAVTDFEINATKRLHFFVIRDDMAHFQHVHPTVSDGVWRVPVDIPDGGTYRMYAEFVPPGSTNLLHPIVLGSTFIVPGDTTYIPMPEPAASVRVGELTVTRVEGSGPVARRIPNTLTFTITDAAGEPVDDLEPYLGSYAHVSAINALTMSVTHLHPTQQVDSDSPAPDELTFRARFAERGEHRVFLEFQIDGQVYMAPITLFVD
jgi:hypothetical protein